jgi:oligopeptide/dipeptide ABC transporter ATP-binding protein
MKAVTSAAHEIRPLLQVRDLVVEFAVGHNRPPLRAVDDVNLTIAPHQTVGVVGESGSGKTTLGRAILGLTSIHQGSVAFDGEDITNARHARRRELSSKIQVVFQDPYSSLNPTRTVGQTLRETLLVHEELGRDGVKARVNTILERVGLPADAVDRYPIHFSGGQRQRIAIARALIVKPRLVICDEAVSALDLSVQAQVLNLLRELQDDFDLSYLFIAHDLSVVRHLSNRILVLYRGRVMEYGEAEHVYGNPGHPYTQALLEAAPVPDPELQQRRRAARRKPPTNQDTSVRADACPFAPRCPHAIEICRIQRPELELRHDESLIACHRWRELPANESLRSVQAAATMH